MFNLCKQSLSASGILAGLTDFHSHILPGVDDGVRTTEEALAALSDFQKAGVKRVVLTPHVMEDYPLNRPEALRERFDALCAAYKGPLTMSLGAEYMLDGAFDAHLSRGGLLTIADDHLLVEVSCAYEPLNLSETLRSINSAGYYAVLAHPERYGYMTRERYKKLKDAQTRFQLNLPSVAGAYGRDASRRAAWLLGQGYYDLMGTDLHSPGSFRREAAVRGLDRQTVRSLEKLREKSAAL